MITTVGIINLKAYFQEETLTISPSLSMRLNGSGTSILALMSICRRSVCLSWFLKKAGVYILQNTMARGGEWCRGKKWKWGSEEQNEKEENEMGESDFYVNIWHTFGDNCILTWHFMIHLWENWLLGKNIKTEDLGKNKKGNHFLLFSFSQPPFFPQQ